MAVGKAEAKVRCVCLSEQARFMYYNIIIIIYVLLICDDFLILYFKLMYHTVSHMPCI